MVSEPASDLDLAPGVLGDAAITVLSAHGVTVAGLFSIVERYDNNSVMVLPELAAELGVPFDQLLNEICDEVEARTGKPWRPKPEPLR